QELHLRRPHHRSPRGRVSVAAEITPRTPRDARRRQDYWVSVFSRSERLACRRAMTQGTKILGESWRDLGGSIGEVRTTRRRPCRSVEAPKFTRRPSSAPKARR